ncbi:hypothetical protein [Acinetobacter schindleri]|uniref:hypothetical protein n=1 Tax=Acinetobacter schindleri TaxID=108981 RepID=UPI003D03633B
MSFNFESKNFKNLMMELSAISEKVELNSEEYSDTVKILSPYIITAEQVLNPNIDLRNYDQLTEYSRAQPVSDFVRQIVEKLNKYRSSKEDRDLIELLSLALNLFYIYFSEIKFRIGSFNPSISFQVDSLSSFVSEYFYDHEKYKRYIQYAERDIPFALIQEIYLSNEIQNLNDLNKNISSITSKVNEWQSTLTEQTAEVEKWHNSLKSYKDAFNFVGIFDGFNELHKKKVNELWWARCGLLSLAASILIALGYEINSIREIIIEKNTIDIVSLIALTVPFTLLIFLLLYFFKIVLQTMRSIQSQLLQLDLRLTLCRFIQGYADSASELKKKHPDGFDKFESIIFSPLVTSDDKIPHTFEGLDQLSSVVNIIKSKDG